MNTEEILKLVEGLMHCLHEGGCTTKEELMGAQVYALIAIAQELRSMNKAMRFTNAPTDTKEPLSIVYNDEVWKKGK